jgi:hypothetical protein
MADTVASTGGDGTSDLARDVWTAGTRSTRRDESLISNDLRHPNEVLRVMPLSSREHVPYECRARGNYLLCLTYRLAEHLARRSQNFQSTGHAPFLFRIYHTTHSNNLHPKTLQPVPPHPITPPSILNTLHRLEAASTPVACTVVMFVFGRPLPPIAVCLRVKLAVTQVLARAAGDVCAACAAPFVAPA